MAGPSEYLLLQLITSSMILWMWSKLGFKIDGTNLKMRDTWKLCHYSISVWTESTWYEQKVHGLNRWHNCSTSGHSQCSINILPFKLLLTPCMHCWLCNHDANLTRPSPCMWGSGLQDYSYATVVLWLFITWEVTQSWYASPLVINMPCPILRHKHSACGF